jgi:hypothetical protein
MNPIGRTKEMRALTDRLAAPDDCKNRHLLPNTRASVPSDWREFVVAEEQKGRHQRPVVSLGSRLSSCR